MKIQIEKRDCRIKLLGQELEEGMIKDEAYPFFNWINLNLITLDKKR